MKIHEALAIAKEVLDLKGVSNGRLDSLILLSHTFFIFDLDASREKIIFNPDLDLGDAQQSQFFELVERRANREPISHITGKREFFGRDFIVNSNVLDPRPDSETLIELVFEKNLNKDQKINILELGAGSGCLILTLLKSYKNAQGIAVDISDKALEVCEKNTAKHEVQSQIRLIKSDLFQSLKSDQLFDLIISNPPYIISQEINLLQPEVKLFEPKLALDGGLDGLDFYRRIADKAQNFMNKNARIIIEIGFGQEDEIVKIFSQKNFIFDGMKLDLAGVVRVLSFINADESKDLGRV